MLYCLGRKKKEWGREVRGYSLKEEVEEEAAAGVRWSEQRQRSVQISPKEHLKDPAEGSLLGCFAPQKQEV